MPHSKAFQYLCQPMAIQPLLEDHLTIITWEPPGYLPVRRVPGASKAINSSAPATRVLPTRALQYLFQPMAIKL